MGSKQPLTQSADQRLPFGSYRQPQRACCPRLLVGKARHQLGSCKAGDAITRGPIERKLGLLDDEAGMSALVRPFLENLPRLELELQCNLRYGHEAGDEADRYEKLVQVIGKNDV